MKKIIYKNSLWYGLFFLLPLFSVAQIAKDSCTNSPFCTCNNRPDEPPLGIIVAHTHPKGEWTISYTFMDMMLVGNKSGSSKITDNQIFQQYYSSPDLMNMQSHMLMLMYGLSNKITLMTMFSINENSMKMNMNPTMKMPDGAPPISAMNSTSSGFGDTKIYGLYNLKNTANMQLIVALGFTIPTGSIEQKGLIVTGDSTGKVSYNMQLGTGSFGILPAITYAGFGKNISWGISANANIETGANSEGYQWGNQYTATSWFAYKWCNYLSSSFRLEAENTDAIKGYDATIAQLMFNDPTANTANYGGFRSSAYLGLNFFVPNKNLRIEFEFGMPFYENLNGSSFQNVTAPYAGLKGPQLSEQSNFLAGIQYSF